MRRSILLGVAMLSGCNQVPQQISQQVIPEIGRYRIESANGETWLVDTASSSTRVLRTDPTNGQQYWAEVGVK